MPERDRTAEELQLFKPPKELLILIKHQGVSVEMILPTFTDSGDYAYVTTGVLAGVEDFFRRRHLQKGWGQLVSVIFSESLMNAAEHGNKGDFNKKVQFGCWYGEEGLLFGIRDQGEFFSQSSTKKLIESRTILPSSKKDPSGFGLSDLYKADRIDVDTEQNTLFFVISVETITNSDRIREKFNFV